ncbi:MAG TPA: hypothetical protein PLL10_10670, partial [Elusimicrobiales bacterium]|nr:hypothetical protein [Elusimicrobiales bacterium]
AINDDEQAKANDYHRAAAAFECSLVKLGDIPRKEITRALLMGLSELDVEELTSARGRLQRRGPEQP